MEEGDAAGDLRLELLLTLDRAACVEERAERYFLADNAHLTRGIEVVAVEVLLLITALVGRAARRVTDRKNESDDDDRQESEEYPAAVADEVILNPRNHDKRKRKRCRLGAGYALSTPCLRLCETVGAKWTANDELWIHPAAHAHSRWFLLADQLANGELGLWAAFQAHYVIQVSADAGGDFCNQLRAFIVAMAFERLFESAQADGFQGVPR